MFFRFEEGNTRFNDVWPALVKNDAAVLIKDSEAERELADAALKIIKDPIRSAELSRNIGKLALPQADEVIAREVLRIANSAS